MMGKATSGALPKPIPTPKLSQPVWDNPGIDRTPQPYWKNAGAAKSPPASNGDNGISAETVLAAYAVVSAFSGGSDSGSSSSSYDSGISSSGYSGGGGE
jgi:hypothetical protein